MEPSSKVAVPVPPLPLMRNATGMRTSSGLIRISKRPLPPCITSSSCWMVTGGEGVWAQADRFAGTSRMKLRNKEQKRVVQKERLPGFVRRTHMVIRGNIPAEDTTFEMRRSAVGERQL